VNRSHLAWELLSKACYRKKDTRMEVTGRRERRRKGLLYDLKEKRGYWKLQEEALDRAVSRTRFRRDYGPVVRAYRMNV
jgi:hypothetical protein